MMNDDIARLDPAPYLAAARLRIAELGRCEPGSEAWKAATGDLVRAAARLDDLGVSMAGRPSALGLVGVDPFHPDGDEAVGRRNCPEECP